MFRKLLNPSFYSKLGFASLCTAGLVFNNNVTNLGTYFGDEPSKPQSSKPKTNQNKNEYSLEDIRKHGTDRYELKKIELHNLICHRDKPMTLVPKLVSKWSDFYDEIDPIFTYQSNNDEYYNEFRERMEKLVRATQDHYVYELQNLENEASSLLNIEPVKFVRDEWKRNKSGAATKYSGGITKVLSDGLVFEKAGVSVSISSGKLPLRAVKQMTSDHPKLNELIHDNNVDDTSNEIQYYAASVSSVVHPYNPHNPTGHFNYRYFELGNINPSTNKFESKIWWFGGGGDLTPSILYNEDCIHFHNIFKTILDKYNNNYYNKFKLWCDNYFVIKHRNNECRGIGGIFFDDIYGNNKEEIYNMIQELASNWTMNYIPIVKRHMYDKYNNKEKEWQQIRRGRYVEFNLVYDRGTKFGLMKPSARIESILMSLPLTSQWHYCRDPKYDFEKQLYDVILNPKDWLA